jgi:hypothetical protein
MAHQGRFIPKNPQKYVGRSTNQIMFRSSWECAFMKWLDTNNAILRWGSEELAIPYVHPFDGRMHRYYPDMVIMYMDTTGAVKREIIEIKPHKESVVTPKMTDRDRQALMINQAKWKYAAEYAEKNGAVFRVLTEQTMFKQKPKKAVGAAV